MKVLIGTHISTKPQKSLTIEDVWDTVAREGSVSGSDTERQGSQRVSMALSRSSVFSAKQLLSVCSKSLT